MPLPSFPKFEQPYKLTCLYISLSTCFPFPGFPFCGRQSICRRAYASDRSGEIHPYHLAKIYGREGHCHIIAFIGVGKHHYVSLTNFIFLPQPLHISFPLHADTPGKAFKAMIHGQSTSRPNLPSGFRQFFRILLSVVHIPLFYSPFPLKHPQKNSAPPEKAMPVSRPSSKGRAVSLPLYTADQLQNHAVLQIQPPVCQNDPALLPREQAA